VNDKTLGFLVAYSDTSDDSRDPKLNIGVFDEVVVASPWVLAEMNTEPAYRIPYSSWEKMHVTVFTTPGRLAPGSFGLGDGDHPGMPQRILSTLGDSERNLEGYSGGSGVGKAGWWTIEHSGTVTRPIKENDAAICDDPALCKYSVRTENVYKILSPSELSNDTIMHMLSNQEITWIYRHFWKHAFVTPSPSRFDKSDMKIKLDDGLWYTAGVEGSWGGLEAAVTMGKRVAAEIHAKWSGRQIMRGTVMLGQNW